MWRPLKPGCFAEIPLFHVLNARVTFSNLCGCDEPVSSVTVHKLEGTDKAGDFCCFLLEGAVPTLKKRIFQLLKHLLAGHSPPPFLCEVDPSVFEPPADYTTLGPGRSEPMRDEDDNLLQFAIQQSLLDAGTESDQVGELRRPLLAPPRWKN